MLLSNRSLLSSSKLTSSAQLIFLPPPCPLYQATKISLCNNNRNPLSSITSSINHLTRSHSPTASKKCHFFLSKNSPFFFRFSSSFSAPLQMCFSLVNSFFLCKLLPPPVLVVLPFCLIMSPICPTVSLFFETTHPSVAFLPVFHSHIATQKQLIPSPLCPPKTAHPWVVRKMGNLLPKGSTTGSDLCAKFNSKSILLSQTNYFRNNFVS